MFNIGNYISDCIYISIYLIEEYNNSVNAPKTFSSTTTSDNDTIIKDEYGKNNRKSNKTNLCYTNKKDFKFFYVFQTFGHYFRHIYARCKPHYQFLL